ncbi:MAG: response regulator [Oligoflexia bacterium]|nr:response regulator [Oligoflexia bacterium]
MKSELEKKLEEQEKQKEEFLAIVSHDLKNPLSVIKTSMEILKQKHALEFDAETISFIDRSKRASEVALDLIINLLDQARIEGKVTLNYQMFSLSKVIEDCIDAFKFKCDEKETNIKVSFEKDFEIYADYGRISQVISNLISNALKYIPLAGTIEIKTSYFEGKRKSDLIKDFVKISVIDNGIGISQEKIKELFVRFKQAREEDEKIGTGLGLSIAKKICELHGGNIWVESIVNEGTTFNFILPITQNVIEHKRGGFKILVVDDAIETRTSCKAILENAGYIVDLAENGLVALNKIKEKKPDLLLLDLDMPIMNGYQLLKTIDQLSLKTFPVLIYSHSGDKDLINDIYHLTNDYIQKPASSNQLQDTIDCLLGIKATKASNSIDNKKVVLIVDNEDDVRRIIANEVEFAGLHPIMARNGIEALYMIRKYKTDAVITELSMPVMDGYRLIEQLNLKFPKTPIIIASNDDKESALKIIKSKNIIGFMPKPFNSKAIKEALNGIKRLKDIEVVGAAATRARGVSAEFNILIADDDEEARFIYKAIFKGIGINDDQLDLVESGEEALSKLELNEKKYQIIFLDFEMPKMSGGETAAKIRAIDAYKELPIVALTAHSEKDFCKKVESKYFSQLVSKPINQQSIENILNKYLSVKIKPLESLDLSIKDDLSLLQQLNSNSNSNSILSIDFGKMFNNFSGKSEIITNVLKIFIENFPERMNILKTALKSNDNQTVMQIGHTFAGIIASFECPELYNLAYELEKVGETKANDSSNSLYDESIQSLNELENKLTIFIDIIKEKFKI